MVNTIICANFNKKDHNYCMDFKQLKELFIKLDKDKYKSIFSTNSELEPVADKVAFVFDSLEQILVIQPDKAFSRELFDSFSSSARSLINKIERFLNNYDIHDCKDMDGQSVSPKNAIEKFIREFDNKDIDNQGSSPRPLNPRSHYEVFFETANLILSYMRRHSFADDVQTYKKSLEKELREIENKIDQKLDSIDYKTKEVDEKSQRMADLINRFDESTVTFSTQKFIDIFKKQASAYWWSGFRWLVLTIFVAALCLIVIGWFIYDFHEILLKDKADFNGDFFIQFAFLKFLLVSFLSFILFQVIKIYNANQHLYAINKHRENCLSVFDALVEGDHDKQVKEAILLQAVRSIFDTGNTGFINQKNNDSISILDASKMVRGHDEH